MRNPYLYAFYWDSAGNGVVLTITLAGVDSRGELVYRLERWKSNGQRPDDKSSTFSQVSSLQTYLSHRWMNQADGFPATTFDKGSPLIWFMDLERKHSWPIAYRW